MRPAFLFVLAAVAGACSRSASDHAVLELSAAPSTPADDGLPTASNTEPLDEAPVVAIEREQILVDGAVVGDVKAVLEVGRIQRIDGEFAALKLKREAWKTAHPDAPFPGVAVLRLPRDTKAVIVKSVFQTAAFSGYPNLAFAVGTGAPRRIERVRVDAQVPGPPAPGASQGTSERALFVRIAPDKPVTFTWKRGSEVLSVSDRPWRDSFERSGEASRAPGLAAKVAEEWKQQREHFDPNDKKLDRAMLQVDDATELREIVAAIDAIRETRRSLGNAQLPAFAVVLSVLAADPPASTADGDGKSAPKVGLSDASVDGRLPPEVIRRIVRQNTARFRKCYEAGLAKDASLKGKVVARFVIGKDGSVANVTDGGSDLADGAVKKCVLQAFRALSFPAPEGGVVTVTYPLDFTPGG
jgi:hypothetical protein